MTLDVLHDPSNPQTVDEIDFSTIHPIQDTLVAAPGEINVPDLPSPNDALLALLPLLIVISTFLFLLLLFLLCVLLIRRRRGIVLGDNDGPVDMSREDMVHGDGGFEGVESRWLEGVTEPVRRSYLRAKGLSFTSWWLRALMLTTCFLIFRIPATLPSKFSAYRYHSIAILVHPGKRRIRVVV